MLRCISTDGGWDRSLARSPGRSGEARAPRSRCAEIVERRQSGYGTRRPKLSPMPENAIAPEDPSAEDVRRLLGRHLAFAHAHSAPEEVFALDVDKLLDPAVSFFGLRVDGDLLA